MNSEQHEKLEKRLEQIDDPIRKKRLENRYKRFLKHKELKWDKILMGGSAAIPLVSAIAGAPDVMTTVYTALGAVGFGKGAVSYVMNRFEYDNAAVEGENSRKTRYLRDQVHDALSHYRINDAEVDVKDNTVVAEFPYKNTYINLEFNKDKVEGRIRRINSNEDFDSLDKMLETYKELDRSERTMVTNEWREDVRSKLYNAEFTKFKVTATPSEGVKAAVGLAAMPYKQRSGETIDNSVGRCTKFELWKVSTGIDWLVG